MKTAVVSVLGLLGLSITGCGGAVKELSESIKESKQAAEKKPVAGKAEDPNKAGDGEISAPITVLEKDGKSAGLREVSVTPPGCKALSAQLFVTPEGLFHTVHAQCAGTAQVYGLRTTREGTAAGAFDLLTDCRYGVESFSADAGPSSFLLAYTCSGTGTYVTHAREVVPGMAPGAPREIQRLTGLADFSTSRGLVKYNPDAGEFGYAAKGLFLRLDTTGEKIGGPLKIDADGAVADLTVQNGRYEVLHTGGINPVTFSAISEQGIPEVLSKPLLAHAEGSGPADTARFADAGLILGYSSQAKAWRLTPHKDGEAEEAPAITQGNAPAAVQTIAQIDNSRIAVVSKHEGSLLLGVLQVTGVQRVLSQRPIGGADAKAGSVKIVDGNVLLSLTKNGKAWLGILNGF